MRFRNGISRGALAAAIAIGAAAGLHAGSAAAQTTAAKSSQSEGNSQEVIVTASKRKEKLHDVAEAITAVTGADLELRQELTFQDFAVQVPGFYLQTINSGWNRLVLQGQYSSGPGAVVGTVIDDFPLSFSGSDSNAGLVSTNPEIYNMDHIEVIKGPQGDLYGAAAEAGIIKYVTDQPNLTAFKAGLETGFQSVDMGQQAGDVKGFVNIPLFNGKAAIHMMGYDEELPGWINDPLTGQQNVNHGSRFGYRIEGLYKPTDDLSVKVLLMNQTQKVDGDGSAEVVGSELTYANAPANQFALADGKFDENYLTPSYTKNLIDLLGVDVEYDLHWAKFSSLTSYGIVKNTFHQDLSFAEYAPGVPYKDVIDFLFGESTYTQQRQTEQIHKYNQEFRLASDPGSSFLGRPLDWQGGLFFTREAVIFDQGFDAQAVSDPNVNLTGGLEGPLGAAVLPSQYEEAAFFGEVDYHILPTVDITAGARNTYSQQWSQIQLYCCVFYGPTDTLQRITSYEDSATWEVSPSWHVTPDFLLYARFATGHRPGGPNLLIPGAPPDFPYTYKSDSTMNYTVGTRFELFEKRLNFDVDAYYVDWTDEQVLSTFHSTSTGQNYNVTGNAGNAEVQGVEWKVDFIPLPNLRFSESGAYTDTFVTTSSAVLGATAGQSNAYVPRWRNTLNIDYDMPAFDDYRYYAGGTYVFESTRWTDFSSSVINPRVELPAYSTLDLHVGIRSRAYNFEVFLKNATNAKGINTYQNAGGYNNTGLANFIQPETVGVRITGTFN